MEDQRDAETLRRRLYRPGASAADLNSYLGTAPAGTRTPPAAERPAEQEHGAEPVPAPPRRRRWPFVLAGAILAVVLAGAAVGVGALAPTPAPPPSAVPTGDTEWTSVPRDPGDSLVATAVLDGGRRPHATGRAVPAPGRGYLYRIAADDRVTAIASRFHLCTGDVLVALPYGADPRRPPVGQRLLLERGALPQPRTTGSC